MGTILWKNLSAIPAAQREAECGDYDALGHLIAGHEPTHVIYVYLRRGGVVEVSPATGVALLRGGTQWAAKAMYVVVGWLALVGPAVGAMGIAMEINHEPAASLGKTAMFNVAAGVFIALAARLYWPVVRGSKAAIPRRARGGFGRLSGP